MIDGPTSEGAHPLAKLWQMYCLGPPPLSVARCALVETLKQTSARGVVEVSVVYRDADSITTDFLPQDIGNGCIDI
jgi:hypothetical protein